MLSRIHLRRKQISRKQENKQWTIWLKTALLGSELSKLGLKINRNLKLQNIHFPKNILTAQKLYRKVTLPHRCWAETWMWRNETLKNRYNRRDWPWPRSGRGSSWPWAPPPTSGRSWRVRAISTRTHMSVVVDDNILTSQGPGTSYQIPLEIVKNNSVRRKVRRSRDFPRDYPHKKGWGGGSQLWISPGSWTLCDNLKTVNTSTLNLNQQVSTGW